MWSATRLGRRSAAPPRRRLHRATRARLHAPHTPHTACVEAHLQTHSARLKLLRATDVYTPFVQPTAPVESATSGPNREPSTQKSNQKSNGCQSVRQWLSFLSLRTVVRAQRSYEPCYDNCWYQRQCGAVGVHLSSSPQHEQGSVTSLCRPERAGANAVKK
jgi:hypothetical protein